MLKECLPVYPGGYSMILNKNSTSSTINSLQGLSGSSQSGWCCRNLSVFHMFFISGGSKSERISTTETTRKRRPPSGGYSFQYGRSWTGRERSCVIWHIPKTSKNIRETDFLKRDSYCKLTFFWECTELQSYTCDIYKYHRKKPNAKHLKVCGDGRSLAKWEPLAFPNDAQPVLLPGKKAMFVAFVLPAQSEISVISMKRWWVAECFCVGWVVWDLR